MANNSKKKLMVRSLNGETLKRPPFWFMRQAGRYLPEYRKIREKSKDFLNFCYTPDLAVEATLQPIRRYQMDAAILFCDILVVPDALGQKVNFIEGRGPILEPLRTLADIRKLSREMFHSHLASVYETISILAKEIPKETALIGFSGAPWTVGVYMVEGRGGTNCSKILKWAKEEPENFQILIDLLTDITADYLIHQIKSGAEIIQIFDSWSGVLNEDNFRRWSINPMKKILAKIKKIYPDVPVIGFPRNVGPLAENYVRETNLDGVSLDENISVDWISKTLQPLVTVQGNLDNKILVSGGKKLDREVLKILKSLSGGPFIFNLGHGILPQTPPDNVGRITELILGWPHSISRAIK
jgi:uroporphyrinogen decarboxylase